MMFYLVSGSYTPNTAPCNRVMAYVKALSELGVKTRVVFFFPDIAFSKVDKVFENIEFEYLWDKHYINVSGLKRISLRLYLRQFVERLQPKDKVFVYGFPDLVVELSKKSLVGVYAERTELPEVSFVCFAKKTTISEYLRACRKITGLIVISQSLKDHFIKNGVPPEQVHIVNMIVDTSRFEMVEKQPSEKYIAYCGSANNNKDGVDELIRAFAILVSKHPEYKLYIIGNAPSKDQEFGNLKLAKSLGVEKNVVFTGLISYQKIPQLLKNAEILALDRPNNLQAQYGFPTKLGEYLSTGNPVVVTSVGDIPLFLKDGESAFIAAPQNTQSFADKLCWAIEHPEESKVIGENGKKVSEQSFNYLTETKKIVKIINE